MSLKDTLGNESWLLANEKAVKEILPETWTHVHNLNGLQLGFQLKLLRIDWRSEEEFGRVMLFLERIGLMLRDGMMVKRNPHSIFKSTTNRSAPQPPPCPSDSTSSAR